MTTINTFRELNFSLQLCKNFKLALNSPSMRTNEKNLSATLKTRAAHILLEHSNNGKIIRGKMKEVAALLCISRRSLSTIWAATKKLLEEGKPVSFTETKWSKHKDCATLDLEMMKTIPFRLRSTIRRLAKELNVSKSVVGRWIKSGLIKAHTNAIKPDLTAQNKLLRLKFCLSSLLYDRALNIVKFKSMDSIVHIDEKWFFITKECERYYMIPGEMEPYRSCKSKRFITKIMFMCAVARPQYASNGDLIFYGKIGIFPFTYQEPAKRNSKNRRKGTLETKPVDSITKEVIKACIINKIIPAIKSKWPLTASRDIIIQQDNAKPHINNNDTDFRVAASSDGFNISLVCQPANSPDTNINDLGWFRAIQSLQVETASYTMDDLVKNVLLSFEKLTAMTLNNVFISLQGCMIEIMKCKGHNSYKVPHMNKSRLMRQGILPHCLQVEELLVKESIDYLMLPGNDIVSSYDVDNIVNEMLWL